MGTIRDLGVIVIVLGLVLVFLTVFALAATIRENIKMLKVVSDSLGGLGCKLNNLIVDSSFKHMGLLVAILLVSFIAGILFFLFSGRTGLMPRLTHSCRPHLFL
jgi:hypothetical protein